MEPWQRALRVVSDRAETQRHQAIERIRRALGPAAAAPVEVVGAALPVVARLTLNFHPDRMAVVRPAPVGRWEAVDRETVAAGLARQGRYRSQWVTWISNGGRSALPGGARAGWEQQLFGGAYDRCDPAVDEYPVYGALDLLNDPHGGSPRFGSSYLVLAAHVAERATLCVGDSHLGPVDVGTAAQPLSILAGLAEQASGGRLLGRSLGADDLMALLVGDGSSRAAGPARDLDHYVEAQIHGGVDLATDVVAVVLDPSFGGTGIEHHLADAAARHRFELSWHGGSELHVDRVPADFRGPAMPELARRVAGPRGVLDASAIGEAAASIAPTPPTIEGDPDHSDAQQLKYLWHTLLAKGDDAGR